MKFLNNMSKTTTDVLGAIIAVTIFWFSLQFFINTDEILQDSKTSIVTEKKED